MKCSLLTMVATCILGHLQLYLGCDMPPASQPATIPSGHAARASGALKGILLRSDGRPAAKTQITLNEDRPSSDRGRQVRRQITDASGGFHFEGLSPGTYWLIAGTRAQGWLYRSCSVGPKEELDVGKQRLTTPPSTAGST
jgi:hypothetical protein